MMFEADDISWLGIPSLCKLRCSRSCAKANTIWSKNRDKDFTYVRCVAQLEDET